MGKNMFEGLDLDKMAATDPFMAEFLGDYISDADYSGLKLDGLTAEEIHQTGVDYRDAAHYKKTDLGLAKKYFQAAAGHGLVAAWYDLGFMYCTDMIPNYEKALHWFKKAAGAGNSDAMLAIGGMFNSGNGVEKDEREVLRWYQAAADAGNAEAWRLLGGKAYGGSGGAESSCNAFTCYQKSAELGSGQGMYLLARLYRNGDGTEQNAGKAVEWLEKAVEAGNGDALDILSEMYGNGEVTNRPCKNAAEWLQAAPYGADAAVNLAASYRNIDGEKPEPFSDYGKAVYWYEQAAAKGSVKAMNALVELYARGGKHGEKSTLPIDMKKAARWVIEAAETGDATAMYVYSLWLDPPDGLPCGGVARDKAKSFAWLNKAAEAGSADAMYQLGQVYSYDYYGNGLVPKDLKLARQWYVKAQAHGSDIAYAAIANIDDDM